MFNRNSIIVLAALIINNVAHAAGIWTVTGSMNLQRESFTTTLLPNGTVLAVGGEFQDGIYNPHSATEIYNPTTGTWSFTGSMSEGRYGHTATLLNNGKILVAAGNSKTDAVLASAELYDPNTGSWTTTGSMSQARYVHTATLLRDGKVLIAGGRDSYATNLYSSAELYDPDTGTWTATGSLNQARLGHTSTLLPNGKVLVAGGAGLNYFTDYSYSTAELYDPATGTWSVTGSMRDGRFGHTTTLLPNGDVFVAGGFSNGGVASAELYHPATGVWSVTGTMSTARVGASATLLRNGEVLVAGGNAEYSQQTPLASAELFNPATGTWRTAGIMGTGHRAGAATLLPNGNVLVAGGAVGTSGGNNISTTAVDLYTPDSAPSAVTNAPSVITSTTAKLSGTVNPNGATTTVTFDFGPTTNYGTSIAATPATIAATAGATAVSADTTGLTCNTTYHYRAKATNSAGTAIGNDQSFTTANCPPVNGVCGTANGATFSTAPTTNLCSSGTASAVSSGSTSSPSGYWTWNCNGANGGTTASCSANLTPTNANAWLYPPNSTVLVERPIELNIYANSNGVKIGSYDFLIKYESSKLAIDYLTSITQCAKEAVCPGADGWSNYTVINAPSSLIENGITYSTIRVSGLNTTGTGPGTSLQLLKIYLKTQIVPSTTAVNLTINRLESTYLNPIGTQNSAGGSATIRITPGLCGDADGNGAVNIIDALAIARKQVGLPPPPYVNVDLANVKRSDELNITDAMLIARYSVGLLIPPEACAIGQPL